ALHELATNAVKHGALSVPSGSVHVNWTFEPDDGEGRRLRIVWRERGGPAATPPTKQGFGYAVINRLVPIALEGKVALEFAQAGFSWMLVMPAKEVVELNEEKAAS